MLLECGPQLVSVRNGLGILTVVLGFGDEWDAGLFEVGAGLDYRRLLEGTLVMQAVGYPSFGSP